MMTQVSPIVHIDMHVSNEKLFADTQNIVYETFPSWKDSELKLEKMTGGYVNTMIRCWRQDKPWKVLIIRVWSKRLSGSVLDNRDIEVKNCEALSLKGCFPKMASTFANGYCYYSYEGFSICDDLQLLKEYSYLNAVTKGFVMFHTTNVTDVSKKPCYFRMARQSISNATEENIIKLQKYIPNFSVDYLRRELDLLEEEVNKLDSPIVFCHLDGHVRNILWNQKDEHVTFVDCEMSKYSYQALDIAYHFVSFYWDLIVDDLKKLPLPLETYMKLFIQHYLKYWFEAIGKKADDVQELDVEVMLATVKKFMPLVNLYVVTLCVDMKNNFDKFDTCKFARDRHQDYLRMKSEYLKLPIRKC